MLSFILISIAISLAINIVGFLIAFRLKTDKLTDFSYALSFFIVNTIALVRSDNINLANIILLGAITLWAIRLGSYLVIRIKKWGRDRRFDEVRNKFFKFFQFWFFQGLTVGIVSISSLQFFTLNQSSELSIFSIVGLIIFIGGLITESFADIQLFKFSNQPKNKGKFIDEGLWSYSRHPNYLGEISVWLGLWIFTLGNITKTQELVGFISPLFIFLMIRFVSGVPKLEKSAKEKWGSQKEYQAYRKRTGNILPKPHFNKSANK